MTTIFPGYEIEAQRGDHWHKAMQPEVGELGFEP